MLNSLCSSFEWNSMIKEICFRLLICREISLSHSPIKAYIGIIVRDIVKLMLPFSFSYGGYPKGSGAYVFRPLTSTPEPISTNRTM